MRIGIVTTWFERGAAYVSRMYMENLEREGHLVYIYARGGESFSIGDSKWDSPNVTWGKTGSTSIKFKNLRKWILNNQIECIFFNEQNDFTILAELKRSLPNIKIGAYVDYYKENTIDYYRIYDFLICNTKRHFFAMRKHPQCFYLPWGTDITLFSPKRQEDGEIVFFHSVGMSQRKGTDILINCFINHNLYKESKLIIHTQIDLSFATKLSAEELKKYNIDVIHKTVSAPGLYHLGDVYVYPTKLDGLGLTLYEALACGMPVITTDYPPMNEIIDFDVGSLVDVEYNYCRSDAYYWPMSVCSEHSLFIEMKKYIDDRETLKNKSINARKKALEYYNWANNSSKLSSIFLNTKIINIDNGIVSRILSLKYTFSKRIINKLSRMFSKH